MSEENLFKLFKKGTFEINYLRIASKTLNLPLSYFLDEYEISLEKYKQNDSSSFVEFLRKENESLRGFIKEKLSVNFSTGELVPNYGSFLFTQINHKPTYL